MVVVVDLVGHEQDSGNGQIASITLPAVITDKTVVTFILITVINMG